MRGGYHGNGAPRHEGHKEGTLCGEMDLRNARCYMKTEPDIYDASRAVIHVLTDLDDGSTNTCTGWLVGPNNYMMTNNHCISTQRDAENTDVRILPVVCHTSFFY